MGSTGCEAKPQTEQVPLSPFWSCAPPLAETPQMGQKIVCVAPSALGVPVS